MTGSTEGITITGAGQATASPDLMRLDLAAEFYADRAAEALDGASQALVRMRDALLAGGVSADDLATSGLTVHPQFDHTGGRPRVVGYQASVSLRVAVRDLGGAGDLVAAVANAGGDATRINNMGMVLSDQTSLATAAREAAWMDALQRAELYARLSGRRLGRVLSITEREEHGMGPRPMMARAAFAESAAFAGGPPIDAGEATVTAAITVRWELT